MATEPDPPLDDNERRVLDLLMDPRKQNVTDRTLDALTDRAGLEKQQVHLALRGLETRSPQLARPEVDERLDVMFWMSTYAAADLPDSPSSFDA